MFPKDFVLLFELLVKASIDEGALDVLIEGTEAVGGRDDPPKREGEILDVKSESDGHTKEMTSISGQG